MGKPEACFTFGRAWWSWSRCIITSTLGSVRRCRSMQSLNQLHLCLYRVRLIGSLGRWASRGWLLGKSFAYHTGETFIRFFLIDNCPVFSFSWSRAGNRNGSKQLKAPISDCSCHSLEHIVSRHSRPFKIVEEFPNTSLHLMQPSQTIQDQLGSRLT